MSEEKRAKKGQHCSRYLPCGHFECSGWSSRSECNVYLFIRSFTWYVYFGFTHSNRSMLVCVFVLSVSVIYSSTLKIKSRVDSMKRITSNKTHINIFHTFIIPPKMEVHRKKTGLTVFCMLSFNFMHSNYMIPFCLDATLKNLFHFGFGWKQNKNHSDEAFDMRLYL